MEPEIYTPAFLETAGFELAAVLFGGFMVLRYGVQIGGAPDYQHGCGTLEFPTLAEAFAYACDILDTENGRA